MIQNIYANYLTKAETYDLYAANNNSSYLSAEEPVQFAKALQPQECIEHETVEFLCEVTKESPVTWYKDGQPIVPSEAYQISSVGTVHKLVIAKATLDDEADYTVQAGPAKSTAALLVDGKSCVNYSDC